MKSRSLLALACAFVSSSTATHAAIDTTAWESRQSFTLPTAGPVRIALPPEVLDEALADLADLRLVGPDGGEVPFVALRHQTLATVRSETIDVTPQLEGNKTIITVALDDRAFIRRLHLVTPAASFVKALTTEVRDTDGKWRTVATNQLIFRAAPGSENLTVALHDAETGAIRLTIDDARDQPVPFTHVVVESQASPDRDPTTLPVAITSTDTSASETRLGLDFALAHRPLEMLTLAVHDAAFDRRVTLIAHTIHGDEITEQILATGRIRRLALPGGLTFSELTFNAPLLTPSAALELAIDNGDSPALTVESVTAGIRSVHIAFQAASAGTFTFLAGRADATAPRYDVASFANEWRSLPEATPTFSSFEKNPGFKPLEPPAIVPELAGPFDPKGWSTRRGVTVVEPGAQVLELDPAALAVARPDLGDIRLARGDRQVPFLIERSSRLRALPLTLTEAPEAKRPRVGRWRIDLPLAGMPLSRLSFRLSEPLFERHAVVLEMLEDSRGRVYPRILGEATWTRRSTNDPDRFTIALNGTPTTRQLFLEIDHGDNQPVAPTSVDAAYPIRRLRFRASTAGELELHYGNASVDAPRYDLTLAAPQLLAAREHIARLDTIAGTTAAGDHEGFSLGGNAATFAFWGALVLVVVVLLWMVARLLPKPPETK